MMILIFVLSCSVGRNIASPFCTLAKMLNPIKMQINPPLHPQIILQPPHILMFKISLDIPFFWINRNMVRDLEHQSYKCLNINPLIFMVKRPG
jgi:hypothetical protein